MVRRISMSQLRSQLQQAQNRQRQAISKINQAIRQYNQGVQSAVNKYNQKVRAHNTQVRAYRQRVQSELSKLASRAHTQRHSTFRLSVQTVHDAYLRYEARVESEPQDSRHAAILDLVARENSNSLNVMNGLLSEEQPTESEAGDLQQTQITDELRRISMDLDSRWRGAVFALHPGNPDAARHFCTSAREVFVQMIDLHAPDGAVLSRLPACSKTQAGLPTRRSKIQFILSKRELAVEELEDFIEHDIQNVVDLFDVFNGGTHGPAGKYDFRMLSSLKSRVEEGILFLSSLVI